MSNNQNKVDEAIEPFVQVLLNRNAQDKRWGKYRQKLLETRHSTVEIPPHHRTDFVAENPWAVETFLKTWNISDDKMLLGRHRNSDKIKTPDYLELRSRQNRSWAMETLEQGKKVQKQQKYDKAVKIFTHAVDIDPGYVESWVARGCALANMKKYKEGLEDLRIALTKEKNHANAKKYFARVAQDYGLKTDQVSKILDNPGSVKIEDIKLDNGLNDLLLDGAEEEAAKFLESRKREEDKNEKKRKSEKTRDDDGKKRKQ